MHSWRAAIITRYLAYINSLKADLWGRCWALDGQIVSCQADVVGMGTIYHRSCGQGGYQLRYLLWSLMSCRYVWHKMKDQDAVYWMVSLIGSSTIQYFIQWCFPCLFISRRVSTFFPGKGPPVLCKPMCTFVDNISLHNICVLGLSSLRRSVTSIIIAK